MKRLSNLFLFLKCLARFLKTGRSNRIPQNPKKILVTQLAKLGDTVCATPVFRALRQHFPNAHLVILARPEYRELLDHSGLVDEYVSTADPNISNLLAQKNFDVAVMVGPQFLTLARLFLANIPCIIVPKVINGWTPYEGLWYKLLRRFVIVCPHSMVDYARREYLRILEPLGIASDDTTTHLGFSPQADTQMRALLEQDGIVLGRDFCVGISPTVGNKIKTWDPEKFAEVANIISQKYAVRIIIFGGPADEAHVDLMRAKLHVPVVDTTNKLSLDQLKALIAKLNVFIATDTGPIYIAEALKVATVDIIGGVDEKVQSPQGPNHKLVFADVPGRPFLRPMNTRVYDAVGAKYAMDAITVEMVVKGFDELYAVLHKLAN